MVRNSKNFKILLVTPASLEFQKSEQGRNITDTPDLSMSFLYQWLKKQFRESVDIQIIDQVAYKIGFEEIPRLVQTCSPDLVGISSKTFNVLGAFKIAEATKATLPHCVTVLGGSHATALPVYTLEERPHLDVCAYGEGELTLTELIQHLMEGKSIRAMEDIRGIAYRSEEGRLIKTPPRPLIEDIDILPYPTYEEYDMSRFHYQWSPFTRKEQVYFSIFGSRGCAFRCTFCMPVLTRKFRYRNPDLIMKEIRFLRNKFGVEHLYFEDSCMSTNKKWFMHICEAFRSTGLSSEVKWGFETRVDLVDEELLLAAAKAGCIYITYGLESADDLVLKRNRKGFTTDTILKAVKLTRKCGIPIIQGHFILGLPYETRNTIENMLNFIDEIDLDRIGIHMVDVYPGTELFNMVDRGEGGTRWLPGKRMNWAACSRDSCQIEVNDLTEELLMNYYRLALDLVESKTKVRYSI